MSDVKDVEMSLEDLFLSHEFGKVGAAAVAPTLTSPGLFPEFEAPALMVPRAGFGAGSVAIGHSTTTHQRRNRTYAVMSGAVAAALVVAIGISGASTGRTGKTTGVQAAGATGSGSGPITGGHPGGSGTKSAPTPSTVSPGGPSNPATLADTTGGNSSSGGGGGGTTIVITIPPPNGSNGGGGGGGGGTSGVGGGGGNPAPTTGTSGTLLAPVIHLVGQVVNTTGGTVTIVATGLGGTLPVLSPVTGLVGNVSGTLSEVGSALSRIA
jgi:hypothetical protein